MHFANDLSSPLKCPSPILKASQKSLLYLDLAD